MNRNNGRKIAERLMLLQKYFIENADRTHAVSMEGPLLYVFWTLIGLPGSRDILGRNSA